MAVTRRIYVVLGEHGSHPRKRTDSEKFVEGAGWSVNSSGTPWTIQNFIRPPPLSARHIALTDFGEIPPPHRPRSCRPALSTANENAPTPSMALPVKHTALNDTLGPQQGLSHPLAAQRSGSATRTPTSRRCRRRKQPDSLSHSGWVFITKKGEGFTRPKKDCTGLALWSSSVMSHRARRSREESIRGGAASVRGGYPRQEPAEVDDAPASPLHQHVPPLLYHPRPRSLPTTLPQRTRLILEPNPRAGSAALTPSRRHHSFSATTVTRPVTTISPRTYRPTRMLVQVRALHLLPSQPHTATHGRDSTIATVCAAMITTPTRVVSRMLYNPARRLCRWENPSCGRAGKGGQRHIQVFTLAVCAPRTLPVCTCSPYVKLDVGRIGLRRKLSCDSVPSAGWERRQWSGARSRGGIANRSGRRGRGAQVRAESVYAAPLDLMRGGEGGRERERRGPGRMNIPEALRRRRTDGAFGGESVERIFRHLVYDGRDM
ncbi:hypothetical protein C8J57DRAFT_1249030 [Mycena rebaudengoi]|nr:hypothetical protein C8J57DRAFT_1249030 [Mycena rebaudengoi]